MTLHIVVGEETYFDAVQTAARSGDGIQWIVPKASTVGDEVLLFFPHLNSFVGYGVVLSAPKPGQFGRRACYRSKIGKIRLFNRRVLLDPVLEKFPDWRWATYPRSYTSRYPDGLCEFLESVSGRKRQ